MGELFKKRLPGYITLLLFILIWSGFIYFLVSIFSKKENMEWRPDTSDNEKLERTKNRGTAISVLLTTSSIIQALLLNNGASSIPLLLFYGFFTAATLGYLGDQGFGTDDGFSMPAIAEEVNSSKPKGLLKVGASLRYIFGKLRSNEFWRYLITVFLDMFISMPIQSVIVEVSQNIINLLKISTSVGLGFGPLTFLVNQIIKQFDNILQSFVGFITFLAYTNDTRFMWAYPGKDIDRNKLISTPTIKLATSISAVIYLVANISKTSNKSNVFQIGIPLVDSLGRKLMFVLVAITLLTIGSSDYFPFMNPEKEVQYDIVPNGDGDHKKNSFWDKGIKQTKCNPETKTYEEFKEIKFNVYKNYEIDKFRDYDKWLSGLIIFSIILIFGIAIPFFPTKWIYDSDNFSNASLFKFIIVMSICLGIISLLAFLSAMGPSTEEMRIANKKKVDITESTGNACE